MRQSRPPHGHRSLAPFARVSWTLLLSYLGVMTAIMGMSMVAVYQFFAYSLYQGLDHDLGTIAEAAKHNIPHQAAPATDPENVSQAPADPDGDLDFPLQDMQTNRQTVEWFTPQGHRFALAGPVFTPVPVLDRKTRIAQQGSRRLLTLPFYEKSSHDKSKRKKGLTIVGYIRVSAPTDDIQKEIDRLLTGFGLGGSVAMILIGSTGWWLTRRALHPIEQSMQQLQQFTADASHELRSPLTAIRTAIEVMQSHPERIHPADVKKLAAIDSASRQMTQLVEDLLMLARADGAVSRPISAQIPFPLDELIEDLIESLQPQAAAKQLTLAIAGLREVWIQGDAHQIQRLLINLLDNALQYTPNGGRIEVELDRSDEMVRVQVRDTGIGIAPDQVAHVFDRFWRAETARSQQGLGLGLSIAQAIAHTHGGKIRVKSQVGVGSCFQVWLPEVDPSKPDAFASS